jgi:hypothetical protein
MGRGAGVHCFVTSFPFSTSLSVMFKDVCMRVECASLNNNKITINKPFPIQSHTTAPSIYLPRLRTSRRCSWRG